MAAFMDEICVLSGDDFGEIWNNLKENEDTWIWASFSQRKYTIAKKTKSSIHNIVIYNVFKIRSWPKLNWTEKLYSYGWPF